MSFLKTNEDEASLLKYTCMIVICLIVAYSLAVCYLETPHFTATILSDSMEPTLYRGDIVIIKKENIYTEQDIIAFNVNDDIYIHRIIASLDGEVFRTAGDKTIVPDQWAVEKNDILGRIVIVIPKLGYVNLWLAGK
ncbi:MAG: signal peptidase I [Candidatus Nanohalarchaeota archaeon]|nr:MAG: signal peptidase I [Candidatus Nanohaloarchaeota archaeon]